MWETLQSLFDVFGYYITVPVIISITCKYLELLRKKLSCGSMYRCRLQRYGFITGASGDILTLRVQQIVNSSAFIYRRWMLFGRLLQVMPIQRLLV